MDSQTLHQLHNHLEILKLSGVDFIFGHCEATSHAMPKQPHAERFLRPTSGRPRNDDQAESENSNVPRIPTKKDVLLSLRQTVLQCTKCSELTAKRTHVVFGAGHAHAKLMFVGEAPGHDEDLQGLPFVGKAGQLLTQIIESIGLKRQEVFICNVLKCRPPGNRNPQTDEIMNCEPYLLQQIETIQPKVICALGNFAAQTLLKSGSNISALRGRFHDYHGTKLMCTFHPAYLLRNPNDKRKVWEDMKMIRRALAEASQ